MVHLDWEIYASHTSWNVQRASDQLEDNFNVWDAAEKNLKDLWTVFTTPIQP
jgi:hypothetical protein